MDKHPILYGVSYPVEEGERAIVLPIVWKHNYYSSPLCEDGCCSDWWLIDAEGIVYTSGGGSYWKILNPLSTDDFNGTRDAIDMIRATAFGY